MTINRPQWRRTGLLGLLLGLSLGASAPPAAASKAVRYRFDGCVVEGFLINRSFHHIKPVTRPGQRGPALRTRAYEGRHITVRGWLLPGDRFMVEPHSVRIIGKCRLHKQRRFQATLAWAHRAAAQVFARRGRPADALKHSHRAIRIAPTIYAFYLTRSRIYLQLRNRRAALADARKALALARDNAERARCQALILQLVRSR